MEFRLQAAARRNRRKAELQTYGRVLSDLLTALNHESELTVRRLNIIPRRSSVWRLSEARADLPVFGTSGHDELERTGKAPKARR